VRGLGAAVLTLCAACGTRGAGAGSSDSVYVGLAVADAPDPAAYRRGASLALEVLNAGRASEELPLALREAPASATTPTAIAQVLRDDVDVVGVVGHARDASTQEAAPTYGTRRPLVVVSPTARDDATAAASTWVFRIAPSGVAIAQGAARFAADSLAPGPAAVVYPNDRAGRGFARAFARRYGELGGTVTERSPYLAASPSAFDAYAPRLAFTGPAVVAASGRVADILALAFELDAAGVDAPLVAVPEPWEEAAALTDTLAERIRVAVAFDWHRPETGAAAEFVAAYGRRYAAAPDPVSALAYDAAMLIGVAVREAGLDRRAVRDWIARTGRGRSAHVGATGPLVFDGVGNPVNKPVVIATSAR